MIYLDYNATTPCDPIVVQEMQPWFTQNFGNASSRNHAMGWQADEAVKKARTQVAKLIHAQEQEIIFTSGATESCNLGIKGVFEKYINKGKHIISCQTEHHAVLETCKALEKKGAELTYLKVDEHGLINLEELKQAIRPDTILIAIMYANNETGLIQPIDAIGKIAREHQILFFTDGTQAIGKIPINIEQQPFDLMAISAHKFYGPKGVGALYKRRRNPRVALSPQITGGGQENDFRSGTLNVPGIVGLGTACKLALERLQAEAKRLSDLRDKMESHFLQKKHTFVNAKNALRLPNVSNITIENIRASQLSGAMNHKIAFSLGSACSSAKEGKSHVLSAMGLSDKQLTGSFRISLGRTTTAEEVQEASYLILKAVDKIALYQ